MTDRTEERVPAKVMYKATTRPSPGEPDYILYAGRNLFAAPVDALDAELVIYRPVPVLEEVAEVTGRRFRWEGGEVRYTPSQDGHGPKDQWWSLAIKYPKVSQWTWDELAAIARLLKRVEGK